ncbi:T9SS type A sorting domain-containing protein [Flavobacterium sp. DGU11]|uniref:T9SS type A sorting domain-containing protein n=1 Tax=Flavobacterium arundinis TaxID=3139143 RepID=A0ABU9HWT2_9FLAO
MQKLNKLIVVLAIVCFGLTRVHAQTTILDQTLLTQQSFNTFTAVSVTGAQTWNFSAQYGAVCSGYSGGQSFENEDWLISSPMNLLQANNAQLTFSHTRGPGALVNAGLNQEWYEAFATANYTGNPATTQWVNLGLNQSIANAWDYISSGGLVIPAAAKSANSRIAFRYKSSSAQSATWEIKNVTVTGEDPNTAVFKITNWNTEWLGCTLFGPADETQQINNVAAAMIAMDSDIYCIQEVINTSSQPSIATLVSILGNEWGGAIAPSNTGDCNQRQGIIYKKSKVQLVNSSELSNGNGSQGNTYSYNWTNGRFPTLYNVKLVAGSTLIPVSLVNIHAKAEDNNDGGESYIRRKGGAEGLKGILDGSAYNTKNVIVIGDFNDYLIGTSSNSCSCSISPFKNFTDDTTNYNGITKDIIDTNTNWGTHRIIENIIISNELAGNYVANSAAQEVSVPQAISNYYNTTSDHLPVSARFQFSVLDDPDHGEYIENSWTIYPNPVKNELNVAIRGTIEDTNAEIYDLTGRVIMHEKLNNATLNVSALPAGIYILKMGSSNAKFVKE